MPHGRDRYSTFGEGRQKRHSSIVVRPSLLWALFLYTCWLSIKFLFPKGETSGWWRRLFGPDSLCPNLKDVRDIVGMFRWFFRRGEMPRFDRWTYWEKFDFFAVFWGMMAIGVSGLILWFPQYTSYLLPGWVINIAYVVHSEEAFLAAIFIFTVHFFNNHWCPINSPWSVTSSPGAIPLPPWRRSDPWNMSACKRKENWPTCRHHLPVLAPNSLPPSLAWLASS